MFFWDRTRGFCIKLVCKEVTGTYPRCGDPRSPDRLQQAVYMQTAIFGSSAEHMPAFLSSFRVYTTVNIHSAEISSFLTELLVSTFQHFTEVHIFPVFCMFKLTSISHYLNILIIVFLCNSVCKHII